MKNRKLQDFHIENSISKVGSFFKKVQSNWSGSIGLGILYSRSKTKALKIRVLLPGFKYVTQ